VVQPDDVKRLVVTPDRLLGDAQLREPLGYNARALEERLNVEQYTVRLVEMWPQA
jgi:hypothetical protein